MSSVKRKPVNPEAWQTTAPSAPAPAPFVPPTSDGQLKGQIQQTTGLGRGKLDYGMATSTLGPANAVAQNVPSPRAPQSVPIPAAFVEERERDKTVGSRRRMFVGTGKSEPSMSTDVGNEDGGFSSKPSPTSPLKYQVSTPNVVSSTETLSSPRAPYTPAKLPYGQLNYSTQLNCGSAANVSSSPPISSPASIQSSPEKPPSLPSRPFRKPASEPLSSPPASSTFSSPTAPAPHFSSPTPQLNGPSRSPVNEMRSSPSQLLSSPSQLNGRTSAGQGIGMRTPTMSACGVTAAMLESEKREKESLQRRLAIANENRELSERVAKELRETLDKRSQEYSDLSRKARLDIETAGKIIVEGNQKLKDAGLPILPTTLPDVPSRPFPADSLAELKRKLDEKQKLFQIKLRGFNEEEKIVMERVTMRNESLDRMIEGLEKVKKKKTSGVAANEQATAAPVEVEQAATSIVVAPAPSSPEPAPAFTPTPASEAALISMPAKEPVVEKAKKSSPKPKPSEPEIKQTEKSSPKPKEETSLPKLDLDLPPLKTMDLDLSPLRPLDLPPLSLGPESASKKPAEKPPALSMDLPPIQLGSDWFSNITTVVDTKSEIGAGETLPKVEQLPEPEKTDDLLSEIMMGMKI